MAQGYLAQVQALIAERMKENPEEMKRRLKEIERAKKEAKKAKKAPKSPPKPKPPIDPQLTQELIEQLNEGRHCNLELMKDLIKRGADIKVEGINGTTLHQACWKGDLELIEFCLQSGVDPHLKNKADSHTALEFAKVGDASHLFTEMKDIFEKYGAL